MARRATHLLVMTMVGISLLLGHTAAALGQDVTHERLLNADQEPTNWLMYYGNYQGWRYSPLQQINTANVKRLVVTWKFRTGLGSENFQVTPLVVDGVMYLTNQKNEIFALQAETGTMLWRYTYFHIEFFPRMPTSGPRASSGGGDREGKGLPGSRGCPPRRPGCQERGGAVENAGGRLRGGTRVHFSSADC